MKHATALVLSVLVSVLFATGQVQALQPLETFLYGARLSNPDNREAQANTDAADAQAAATLGRVLPSVTLSGSYTRNQYETSMSMPTASGGASDTVITPYNQWDGQARLTVPLVDLAGFWETGAAYTNADSAALKEEYTALQVESEVAQNYYQVVADIGLLDAAKQALAVSESSLTLTQERFDAGKVPALDLARSKAEVESKVQQLASASYQLKVDARHLRSLTGIEPETSAIPSLDVELAEPEPLEHYQRADEDLPSLALAIKQRVAQGEKDTASRLDALPTINGNATQYFTNAEGLSGEDQYWTASVSLGWTFDVTMFADMKNQRASLAAAQAREDRERLATRDRIYSAWNSVHTAIAQCRSARRQAQVSREAADLARERYAVGMATHLEWLEAERDAFSAEVSRIEADANLVNARAQLQLAAGLSLAADSEDSQ